MAISTSSVVYDHDLRRTSSSDEYSSSHSTIASAISSPALIKKTGAEAMPVSIQQQLQLWKSDAARTIATAHILQRDLSCRLLPIASSSDVPKALDACEQSSPSGACKLFIQSSALEHETGNEVRHEAWLNSHSLAAFNGYKGKQLSILVANADHQQFPDLASMLRAVPAQVYLEITLATAAFPPGPEGWPLLLNALRSRTSPYSMYIGFNIAADADTRKLLLAFLRDPGPAAVISLPVSDNAYHRGFSLQEFRRQWNSFDVIPILKLEFDHQPASTDLSGFIEAVRQRNRDGMRQIVVHMNLNPVSFTFGHPLASASELQELARIGIHFGRFLEIRPGENPLTAERIIQSDVLRQGLLESLDRPIRILTERGKEQVDKNGDVIVTVEDDSSDDEWLKAEFED